MRALSIEVKRFSILSTAGVHDLAILKNEWLIPIGCICLAASILLDRFIVGEGLVDFVIGVLTGSSIVLNLVGLYRSRNQISVNADTEDLSRF